MANVSPDGNPGSSPPPSSAPRDAFQRVKRSPELPAPDAVELRMTPIALGGTLLWAVVFVLTQVFSGPLEAAGNEWWAACARWGVGLGLIGTAVMVVMDRRHFGREAAGS